LISLSVTKIEVEVGSSYRPTEAAERTAGVGYQEHGQGMALRIYSVMVIKTGGGGVSPARRREH